MMTVFCNRVVAILSKLRFSGRGKIISQFRCALVDRELSPRSLQKNDSAGDQESFAVELTTDSREPWSNGLSASEASAGSTQLKRSMQLKSVPKLKNIFDASRV